MAFVIVAGPEPAAFIATIENAIDDSIPSDFMITKLRGSCVLNNLDDIFNLLKN